jgi:hypothetical protein
MTKEALRMALEALEYHTAQTRPIHQTNEAITAIKEALSQRTEQEPVAYLCENAVGHKYFRWKKPSSTYKPIALYTTPPQRTWVGLTGEMLLKAAQSSLAPEQYDHFEAMSKHQPDIYDRLAYAIRVQDE